MQELQTQERLWVFYAILSLMAAVTYWMCYWPRCYFFRARETNFLVAAEEQSKNLESQLRGLIRTGEEEEIGAAAPAHAPLLTYLLLPRARD